MGLEPSQGLRPSAGVRAPQGLGFPQGSEAPQVLGPQQELEKLRNELRFSISRGYGLEILRISFLILG